MYLSKNLFIYRKDLLPFFYSKYIKNKHTLLLRKEDDDSVLCLTKHKASSQSKCAK